MSQRFANIVDRYIPKQQTNTPTPKVDNKNGKKKLASENIDYDPVFK
jgi:hypothetical protein